MKIWSANHKRFALFRPSPGQGTGRCHSRAEGRGKVLVSSLQGGEERACHIMCNVKYALCIASRSRGRGGRRTQNRYGNCNSLSHVTPRTVRYDTYGDTVPIRFIHDFGLITSIVKLTSSSKETVFVNPSTANQSIYLKRII
jgi:hypothetical protein